MPQTHPAEWGWKVVKLRFVRNLSPSAIVAHFDGVTAPLLLLLPLARPLLLLFSTESPELLHRHPAGVDGERHPPIWWAALSISLGISPLRSLSLYSLGLSLPLRP